MTRRLATGLGCMMLISLLIGTGVISDKGALARSPGTAQGPSLAATATSPCGRTASAPTYRHVIWILMENNSYGDIIGSSQAPYINLLASECGEASNYHNITHHSLANYMGITSGASLAALAPFYDDCSRPSSSCHSTGNNLFNQATSWKAYEESMPSPCDTKGTSIYANRHNPAIYYTDLKNCSTHDVPLGTTSNSALLKAFSSSSTAPAFSFVTPNLCDDMHGVPGVCLSNLVKNGDSWLRTWVGLITSTAVYKSGDTAVFITWDEGRGGSTGEACADNTSDQSCHVPLLVIAPSVKAGTVDGAMLNHYSTLKTTEQLLGYPELGLASKASSFKRAFNL
jgi:hypothetical protein